MERHVSADEALAELRAGNQAFIQSHAHAEHQTLLQRLATRQMPLAAILSCADSRTAPEHLFSQGLGDVFVIRVAGNVVAQLERASLEYATAVLGTPLIVVMGHSGCGAVQATIDTLRGARFPGDLPALVSLISPAAQGTKDLPGNWLENAVRQNILESIASLQKSSVLCELIDAGKLKIIGSYHEMESGKVTFL